MPEIINTIYAKTSNISETNFMDQKNCEREEIRKFHQIDEEKMKSKLGAFVNDNFVTQCSVLIICYNGDAEAIKGRIY